MLRIAYLLTTFPQASEAFARREIDALCRQGEHIVICALGKGNLANTSHALTEQIECLYRPGLLSFRAWGALAWLVFLQPAGLVRLLACLWRIGWQSPLWGLRLLRNLPAIAHFARCLKRRGIQQVHAYFLNLPAVLAMAVSEILRLPFSAAGHARDVFVEPAPSVVLQHAIRIRTCNSDAATVLARRVPWTCRHKIRLIHHGLDLQEWHRIETQPLAAGSAARRPFVAAGRLVPKKGFDVLLHAWALLQRQGLPLQLVLAGDGPLAPVLRGIIDRHGLHTSVCMAGWLLPPQLRSLLLDAQALLVPSVQADDQDRDGIPNVLLEAAACGIPAIVTRMPGLCEVVRHGYNGLVCEVRSPDSLAQAVARMASDLPLRDRLGANARSMVTREFDISTCTSRLRAFFAEIQEQHASAQGDARDGSI